MKINFDFNDKGKLSNLEKNELKEKISKIENSIMKKFPKYFDFLDQEFQIGNYIEVHCPFFDYDITVMLSKLREKFIISVLNHKNSVFFGNLLIDGYDCVTIKDLKKYGNWGTYNEDKKLRIFKPM